jgi:hypothetical protein
MLYVLVVVRSGGSSRRTLLNFSSWRDIETPFVVAMLYAVILALRFWFCGLSGAFFSMIVLERAGRRGHGWIFWASIAIRKQ